jgi:hypothetical protein
MEKVTIACLTIYPDTMLAIISFDYCIPIALFPCLNKNLFFVKILCQDTLALFLLITVTPDVLTPQKKAITDIFTFLLLSNFFYFLAENLPVFLTNANK